MDGSISAEHGIGLIKRDELLRYKDPVALDLMRTLKRALDPQNILNPGKVIGDRRRRAGGAAGRKKRLTLKTLSTSSPSASR